LDGVEINPIFTPSKYTIMKRVSKYFPFVNFFELNLTMQNSAIALLGGSIAVENQYIVWEGTETKDALPISKFEPLENNEEHDAVYRINDNTAFFMKVHPVGDSAVITYCEE
jgi:hypothetical protein